MTERMTDEARAVARGQKQAQQHSLIRGFWYAVAVVLGLVAAVFGGAAWGVWGAIGAFFVVGVSIGLVIDRWYFRE